MRIAIIGAGFVGVATCWYLLKSLPDASILLFDAEGIGAGASGIAAGLLHPFAGVHAKLNQYGFEGMQATCQLLDEAKSALNQEVSKNSGLLRIAVDETQRIDFQKSALKYPQDVKWLSLEECQKIFAEIKYPGILIPKGTVVNPNLYLQGLWKSCSDLGAVFRKIEVTDLKSLDDFDLVIVTAGAKTASFPELSHLPLSLIKGQLLELIWPQDIPPLPLPISSYIYVLMHPTNRSCYVGATYERLFKDTNPNIEEALASIQPKIEKILPFLSDAKIVGCQASVRVSTPDHLPIYGKVNKKIWYLTGMGSKGLLYHALFAQKLVKQILTPGI